jgi:hypothetical protein
VLGVESSISVGGGEGSNDPVLCPEFQVGQEGVGVKFNVVEEGDVVPPVTSLLLSGGDGDSVDLGKLSSQVSSCKSKSGGSGQMLKSGGTWSGKEDTSRWVSAGTER